MVSSYAVDDGERLLLFDPLAPPSEIDELAADPETAVVLTAPWHERYTQSLVERLGLFVRPAISSLEEFLFCRSFAIQTTGHVWATERTNASESATESADLQALRASSATTPSRMLVPDSCSGSRRRRCMHLDRFLTARDVLVYHGRYFGMGKRDAEKRADELLAVFDLTARAGTKPNRGGMRRRLLIARALVHRPRLAMLDEPTAGVDLELRHELWRYLRKLHDEEGLTVLLTTHYIEEAEALCERVAFIRSGSIVDEGSPAELVERHGGERLEDAYLDAMRA
jgi:ABC-type cobalamin/Fe3+-siderophores transport system ATPase subunit